MRDARLVLLLALALLLVGADRAAAFRGGHIRGGRHGAGFAHHAAHLRHAEYLQHARASVRPVIFGAWLPALPRHATAVYVGEDPYYYDDGVFYVGKGATCYVTVPPPAGVVIPSLPRGAVTIHHEDETYHYYVGSFYRKTRKGYEVVPAPVGATVAYAPRSARRTTVGDRTYFVHGGVYYLPEFVDGLTLYEVAATPGAKTTAPGVLAELPVGDLAVRHEGREYRYVDGDWFVAVDGGYRAAEAPVGASVPYLPEGVERKGKGFVCEGATYAPYSKEGVTLYKVEGRESSPD